MPSAPAPLVAEVTPDLDPAERARRSAAEIEAAAAEAGERAGKSAAEFEAEAAAAAARAATP